MKIFIHPKRPNEYTDTARIGKKGKVRPEDIKIKVQTKEVTK